MEALKNLIKHAVQIVDKETSHKIIETRKPRGSFVTIDDNKIIAIENEAGDAFVEEFDTEEAAVMWITGEVDTEQAYSIDKELIEAEEKEDIAVSKLIHILRQVNGFWKVRKENGMPIEKITIEINNEGKPYVKIC